MNATRRLDELLQLFSEQMERVRFCKGFSAAEQSRVPVEPVVVGLIDSEIKKPNEEELQLQFQIYLPRGAGAESAEEIFAQMCHLCSENYPTFSAISRNAVQRDSTTGLLRAICNIAFCETNLTEPTGGKTVLLGGRSYPVESVTVTTKYAGTPLYEIGEREAFAVQNAGRTDTVELNGIETAGLERLASFTAVVGETTYESCRFTVISDALHRAKFMSERRGAYDRVE